MFRAGGVSQFTTMTIELVVRDGGTTPGVVADERARRPVHGLADEHNGCLLPDHRTLHARRFQGAVSPGANLISRLTVAIGTGCRQSTTWTDGVSVALGEVTDTWDFEPAAAAPTPTPTPTPTPAATPTPAPGATAARGTDGTADLDPGLGYLGERLGLAAGGPGAHRAGDLHRVDLHAASSGGPTRLEASAIAPSSSATLQGPSRRREGPFSPTSGSFDSAAWPGDPSRRNQTVIRGEFVTRRSLLHIASIAATLMLVIAACSNAASQAPALTDPKEILTKTAASLKDVKTVELVGVADRQGQGGRSSADRSTSRRRRSPARSTSPTRRPSSRSTRRPCSATKVDAIVVDGFAYYKVDGMLAGLAGLRRASTSRRRCPRRRASR